MKKIYYIAFILFFIFVTPSFAEDNSNIYLNSLRLNVEGIVPYFNKDINEYYITVGDSVESLQVDCEASAGANVDISGNEDLKIRNEYY